MLDFLPSGTLPTEPNDVNSVSSHQSLTGHLRFASLLVLQEWLLLAHTSAEPTGKQFSDLLAVFLHFQPALFFPLCWRTPQALKVT